MVSVDNRLICFWQGDRTRNVGVVDSEYVVHEGIQSLGGSRPAAKKVIFVVFSSLVKVIWI